VNKLPPYVLLEKAVGQTPLETVEFWRSSQGEILKDVPLAYAGRLDPMASGTLLILIGDECKVQEKYHGLDKTYTIEVLFGVESDSGDVLGHVSEFSKKVIERSELEVAAKAYTGAVEFPYPIFSSRTVKGKPLHTWALEGRLAEITIPTKASTIYGLAILSLSTHSRSEIYTTAVEKIALLPPVTDPKKALGNDFRRPTVLATWEKFAATGTPADFFTITKLRVTCSSGTYMRTLAEMLGKKVGSSGLAYSIHRDTIGRFDAAEDTWSERFI
jgi:tRNA pseudouridine55 synthase